MGGRRIYVCVYIYVSMYECGGARFCSITKERQRERDIYLYVYICADVDEAYAWARCEYECVDFMLKTLPLL